MADRAIVAIHEAGHVVVARVHGIVVKSATLSHAEGPHVQIRLNRAEIDASPAVALAFTEFCLAGAEAVARYDPAIVHRGDGDDMENARRTLAALYRGANVERAVDALRRRTAALVAEHWAAVIETAEALLAGK